MSNLKFSSTPNPAPQAGNQVTWSTTGGNGNTITWSVVEGSSVTVTGSGSTATVTAVALGLAKIRASQAGGSSIERYACVGELFAYKSNGDLVSAPSNTWAVETAGVSHFPKKEHMDDKNFGAVYQSVENRLVLDFTVLMNALGGDPSQAASFSASASSTSRSSSGYQSAGSQGLREGLVTYAYAPDGTLWKIDNTTGWSPTSSSDPPSGFPSKATMDGQNACLAWAPPGDLPATSLSASKAATDSKSNIIDVSVTCYVLNQDMFPARSTTSDATWYTFNKI